MNTRLGALIAVLLIGVLPSAATALDANGKWRFDSGGFTEIVVVTQTGSTLSFTLSGFAFSGSVTPAGAFTNYSVSATSPFMAAGFGRFMPSGNLLDGRFGGAPPGIPPSVGGVIATRCSCDDGNATSGDGCDAECRVEPCWTCTGDPSVCVPAADGSACEDGAVCTTGETCSSGVCGGGSPVSPCVDMNGLWNRHTVVEGAGSFDTPSDVVQRGSDLFIGALVGTIDPATGAFDVRSANPYLFCAAFDPLIGSVAASGLTYAADGSLQIPNPMTPDVCVSFSATESGTRCGSGSIDLTEACDDGNLIDGDGCSATCEIEQCWTCAGEPSTCAPVGSGPCDDGNDCTTNDACSGSTCAGTARPDGSACGTGIDPLACTTSSCAGGICVAAPFACEPCLACVVGSGCVSQPRSPCVGSTLPLRSLIRVKNDASDAKDNLAWLWNNGAATTLAQLGDPLAGDDYALCMYDESTPTPALMFRATVAGGGTCEGAPCWKATEQRLRYRSSSSPEGITVVSLKSGAAGAAKAVVKARGVHLSDHPYGLPSPPVTTPLRVQLHGSNGLCLETHHPPSSVFKNDPDLGLFKAVGAP